MKPIKLSDRSHAVLEALAKEDGATKQDEAERAIEAYRRVRFLEGLNADYAALAAIPTTWREEKEEREIWDPTLLDGLVGGR